LLVKKSKKTTEKTRNPIIHFKDSQKLPIFWLIANRSLAASNQMGTKGATELNEKEEEICLVIIALQGHVHKINDRSDVTEMDLDKRWAAKHPWQQSAYGINRKSQGWHNQYDKLEDLLLRDIGQGRDSPKLLNLAAWQRGW
jgi:hypothetical protein